MVVPPIVLIGIRFKSVIVCGAALGMETSYSLDPILEVPVGRTKFCKLIAFTTSSGDSPFDCSAVVFRSTCTRHRDDLRTNEIQAIVVELLLRHVLARKS